MRRALLVLGFVGCVTEEKPPSRPDFADYDASCLTPDECTIAVSRASCTDTCGERACLAATAATFFAEDSALWLQSEGCDGPAIGTCPETVGVTTSCDCIDSVCTVVEVAAE